MTGIVDMHDHMLPGVDDGAKNMDETIKLIIASYKQGVRNIIFTPHYREGWVTNKPEVLIKRLEEVKEQTKDMFPDLNLYLGNEIYYHSDAAGKVTEGKIFPLASSRYVLVEFSIAEEFAIVKEGLYSFISEGFIPVLAHAERIQCLHKNTVDRVSELVNMGAYIQINASGVTKKTRFKTKRFVKKLASYDLIHFIATDAHNMQDRKPNFTDCISFVKEKYGYEYAKTLLIDNPLKIINNEYI
jgi:protein-tyrosine phosphatase